MKFLIVHTKCCIYFSITDIEEPRFTECPNSMTIHASKFSQMAYVSWNVAATDNSGVVNVVCSLREGIMMEGVYDQTCDAIDETGNQATCTFSITVSGINDVCSE